MRNRYVIGNWKLNGSLASNHLLLQQLKAEVQAKPGRQCGVCVPYVYLSQAQHELSGSSVVWGAQDVSAYEQGAYTGEVSASMVAELGASVAIVGHSERRTVFGDSDAAVTQKFGMAKQAGLTPVLCVGETLLERESGKTEEVVSRQLLAILKVYGIEAMRGSVLAYEPVWAIGTGKTATPAEAEAVHAYLRKLLSNSSQEVAEQQSILYGGSVKKNNAAQLFVMPNIDGGLIGGASLNADEFLGIWHAL
ncbi:MAG: triose-phosphate isomerase [Betaproteobacteria bacterium]|nr:triose-phosphate isomerase [Betaproteobacteria bacterium]